MITPDVSIDSYYDQPVENKHYFKVTKPEDVLNVINTTTVEKLKEMSKNCYEWFQKNVHSDNAWNNMIKNILYI